MTDPALQALLDKLQIAELLTRYLRSVDRGDVDTLRACYLPGAKFPADPVYAPPLTGAHAPSPFGIIIRRTGPKGTP
jgi:SnoaL-like protein